MRAIVTFEEIAALIERKFNVRLQLDYVDDRTMVIAYKKSFLPSVNINVRVESVNDGNIQLSYQCGSAPSLIIAGAIGLIKERIPEGIEIDTSAQQVKVEIGKIDQLKNVTKQVSLTDIGFTSEGLVANIAIK